MAITGRNKPRTKARNPKDKVPKTSGGRKPKGTIMFKDYFLVPRFGKEIPEELKANRGALVKKKGMAVGGATMKKKGYAKGGMKKGYAKGGTAGMTLAKIRAAAKAKGYKLVKMS